MEEFNFPWGGTYWLCHQTGIARKVTVNKRNKVYSTTHHETHHTTGFNPSTGNMVFGSVSVPRTEVHSEEEIDMSFWIDSGNNNQKYYSYDFEVMPILDGQKISMIWGASSGINEGLHKCLYNHVTGDVYMFPGSFADFGLVNIPKGWLLNIYMVLFPIFLLLCIIFLLLVIFTSKHQMLGGIVVSVLFFGVPAIVFAKLYVKRLKTWSQKQGEINQKAEQLKSSILAYAKTL